MKNIDIAIINPYNKQIVLRDFYSSTISKGLYNWPNVDLLCISGHLKNKFNVKLIDANTDKLDSTKVAKILEGNDLKGLIFSVGKSVLDDDYLFIKEVKEKLQNKSKILVVGGVIYHNALEEIKKNDFIDGCILNFTTSDVLKYFQKDFHNLDNFVYRDRDGKIINKEIKLPENNFKIPVPLHSHLNRNLYQLSHGTSNNLTSVLTSYGCVHKCSFCVSGKINYRYRDVDNILEELDYLNTLGVKEITFRDNIFGFHKRVYKDLLNKMIDKKYKFKWFSDSRVDILDEEMIILMSKAGCYALHFGIETENEETLNKYEKNLKNTSYIKNTIELCKKHGIQTVGYFILGLPGEKKQDVQKTIDYSINIGVDYASFNLPIPIIGTELREESVKNDWIDNNANHNYDGSKMPIITTKYISSDELLNFRKKAYRKFYFRLKFIFFTIKNLKSFFKIKILVFEFLNLVFFKR